MLNENDIDLKELDQRKVWGWVQRQWPDNTKESCGVAKRLAQIGYYYMNGESGEVDLIVTLIVNGARERDLSYIEGDIFEYHCEAIGLNVKAVRELIWGLWRHFDDRQTEND